MDAAGSALALELRRGGATIPAIAGRLGVSPSTASRAVRGVRRPWPATTDATLAWLGDADPAAVGVSRAEYARRFGILVEPTWIRDRDEREVAYEDAASPYHCPGCRFASAARDTSV